MTFQLRSQPLLQDAANLAAQQVPRVEGSRSDDQSGIDRSQRLREHNALSLIAVKRHWTRCQELYLKPHHKGAVTFSQYFRCFSPILSSSNYDSCNICYILRNNIYMLQRCSMFCLCNFGPESTGIANPASNQASDSKVGGPRWFLLSASHVKNEQHTGCFAYKYIYIYINIYCIWEIVVLPFCWMILTSFLIGIPINSHDFFREYFWIIVAHCTSDRTSDWEYGDMLCMILSGLCTTHACVKGIAYESFAHAYNKYPPWNSHTEGCWEDKFSFP